MIANADNETVRVAVVMPCYRVVDIVCRVIEAIGPVVDSVYCVDDKCPDASGEHITEACPDPRVRVLYHSNNLGVGGATMTGYRQALKDGAGIVVKIDGDGQMDPALIHRFLDPLLKGRADYSKGNRFFRLESLSSMPGARLFGNAVLTFMSKLSSGYWNVMDPTNGYTAVDARVLAQLPMDKISNDYFFESDILFRLNTLGAVVEDVPMDASYGTGKSNLKIGKILPKFLFKHVVNFHKRIFYNYFLRNFNIASVELVVGTPLFMFGLVFGVIGWSESITSGVPVTAGTVMLAALPIIVGFQLLLSFLAYDTRNILQIPLHKKL